MSRVCERDADPAGKDVVPRRNLAAAMKGLLDARSKHDLGPLRCSSASALPRVLSWRPWTGQRLIVGPLRRRPGQLSHATRLPFTMHRLGSPAAHRNRKRCGRCPASGKPTLRWWERAWKRACRMSNAAWPELLTVSPSFLRPAASLGKRAAAWNATPRALHAWWV